MSLNKAEERKILIEILDLKKDILKMIYLAQSGHPGGSLSCVNILYILYNKIMNINRNEPQWSDRDILILVKVMPLQHYMLFWPILDLLKGKNCLLSENLAQNYKVIP